METKTGGNAKTGKTKKGKGRRKMGWIIALAVLAVVFGGGALLIFPPWSPLGKEHEEAKNVPIATVDFTQLKDGTYVGEYAGGMYKWRYNKVRVVVDEGRVTGIELLESPAKGDRNAPTYDTLYKRVVDAQSLQVDVVSGATLDSKAFLKGVEDAVVKAEK